eukprot:1188389-Prorocentrum_minimum.AAC.2
MTSEQEFETSGKRGTFVPPTRNTSQFYSLLQVGGRDRGCCCTFWGRAGSMQVLPFHRAGLMEAFLQDAINDAGGPEARTRATVVLGNILAHLVALRSKPGTKTLQTMPVGPLKKQWFQPKAGAPERAKETMQKLHVTVRDNYGRGTGFSFIVDSSNAGASTSGVTKNSAPASVPLDYELKL